MKLGLVDTNWKLSPRGPGIPAWYTLSEKQKDEQDLRMATYAAMIDCVDQNVGKIIKSLKEQGVYENTLILFLHDNGGDISGGVLGQSKGETGTADSLAHYGTCWANVSDVPFQKYKGMVHEGGISTPLIAHWPEGIDSSLNGKVANEPAHLIDVMASFVDITGAMYPMNFKGYEIIPMEGESLVPVFRGKTLQREKAIFFEHGGNRAVRHGKWKIVASKGNAWELYDMDADRTELNNLAKEMPEMVKKLSEQYRAWADRAFVNRAMKKNRKK